MKVRTDDFYEGVAELLMEQIIQASGLSPQTSVPEKDIVAVGKALKNFHQMHSYFPMPEELDELAKGELDDEEDFQFLASALNEFFEGIDE